ncbi:MAG: 50S ribosomal protein L9 [Chloroflexi bacterium]|nr:50S ribosomal protein L9 [Chloroflexota bacterium]
MANMRVVFLEDVQNVAHGGDIKNVKGGFARNYLIPQKLAVPASEEAMKRVEKLQKQAEGKRLRQMADLQGLADTLSGKQIEVEMRTGAEGRLYGSVTNAVVASKLSELIGHEVDRRTIHIEDNIRETGVYSATVRLHADLEATVSLVVYPMGEKPAATITKAEEAAKAEAEAPQETETAEAVAEAEVESAEAEPAVEEEAASESESEDEEEDKASS